MAALTGAGTPVALGRGVTLIAPGLVGTADLRGQTLLGTRAGEADRATDALTAALAETGMVQTQAVEISARPTPTPPRDGLRAPDGRPGLVLEVPDLGPGQGQVLLHTDEQGVLSWHFGEPNSQHSGEPNSQHSGEPNSQHSAGSVVRFVVPREVATGSPAGGDETGTQQRGLITMIGLSVLTVFAFRLLDPAIGAVARRLAESYENKRRPYLLRGFRPESFHQPGADPLDPDGWRRLGTGRALLFLHGTFSSSHSGFNGVGAEALAALHSSYNGRVFAFDHPTLSVDPRQNVDELLSRVPPGARLDVDVIAHSRGGLVARTLANQTDTPLHVGRVAFVGTPNAGTVLADPDRMTDLVDRYTSLLNLLPPGPWSMVTEILEAVLTLVKIIGHGVVGGLPGLAAMQPGCDFLTALDAGSGPGSCFAVEADFEPTGSLASLLRLSDAVSDRAFGAAPNDLVVPTAGVATDGLRVPPEHRCDFDGTAHVWHCGYFSQPRTRECLLTWMTGSDQ
jgi:pimeloyl-ACP methyl ester carboxylesterase